MVSMTTLSREKRENRLLTIYDSIMELLFNNRDIGEIIVPILVQFQIILIFFLLFEIPSLLSEY